MPQSPNVQVNKNARAVLESVKYLDEVRQLLSDCELPTADISSSDSLLFFGCRSNSRLVGVTGLEVFGRVALLRSLAVAPSHRNHGLGRSMVAFAEGRAASLGVESLYLLTTTAGAYFSKLGYSLAAREEAPVSIKGTMQFSALCPASSSLMRKQLRCGPKDQA
jgi:amino-acid N-acetyltransferase